MPERKQQKLQTNVLIYLLLFVAIAALGAGLLLKKDKVRKIQGVAVPVKQEETSVLYVVRGQATVQDNTLAVKPILVEWFTNRPAHEAGRMTAAKLVDIWDREFGYSHPNAAVIGDQADAVVVLDKLSMADDKMLFEVEEIISGNLSTGSIGTVSLFIDWGVCGGDPRNCPH